MFIFLNIIFSLGTIVFLYFLKDRAFNSTEDITWILISAFILLTIALPPALLIFLLKIKSKYKVNFLQIYFFTNLTLCTFIVLNYLHEIYFSQMASF